MTRKRNDINRWKAALDRAITNNLSVLDLCDGRYCVSSATRPGTGYVTNGYDCTCQAALTGDPICQHRAACWHAKGRLFTDDQLVARADAAWNAYMTAFGAEVDAILAGTGQADAKATCDAASDAFDGAVDALRKAGIDWEITARGENVIPANVVPFVERETTALAAD